MAEKGLKKCIECVFADGAWCRKYKLVHSIYGCKSHMTKEEFAEVLRKELREQDMRWERKMNLMLTMIVNAASATQILMERFDSEIVNKNEEKRWRQERKRAFKEIRLCAEKMRGLYETYIAKDIVRSLTDSETGAIDVEKFDMSLSDAHELVRLMIWHWEKCFDSQENADKVFKFYEGLDGIGIYSKEDIEKFRIK